MSKKPDVFHFEHNGRSYTLPRFGKWKAGLTRRIRKLGEVDAMFTILEEVADEETLAAIDDMDETQLAQLIESWVEHAGGVTLGESGSSST